jgi:probable F420-dependent oxidoreductase
MHPFRFAVQCGRASSGREWRERARRIEDLGYATAFCPDHFGDQWAPTVAMTIAAEATTSLKVGALVYDVDYRHPLVLAKEMATLDLASDGRVEFGIGAGWLRTDYDLAGIRYDRPGVRIDRMVEAIEICKGLWSGRSFSYAGQHFTLTDAVGTPAPCRAGGPPVIVGGGGRKLLTVAARHADIVGLNASLHEGTVGPEAARSALLERFVERRRWVEEAAGPERFGAIELHLNTFVVQVVDDPAPVYAGAAGAFGLTPEEARDIPMVLVGPVSSICEQLQAHRERFGASYISVSESVVEEFAPVVARLART